MTEDYSKYPEISDPEPWEGKSEEHKDLESKFRRQAFQVIQADARADKWGQLVAKYQRILNKVALVCKEKADLGKDINPMRILHIIEDLPEPETNPFPASPGGKA